jgi:hypothetical protein
LLGGVTQQEFAILDGATVSTAELNILDGATVTTAEINQLDADSTGALKVPTGTVAQRPTPAQGQIRFNSDDTTFEGYDGTAWGALGGDFSAVAEDIIPDADSTRNLGSASIAWALAYFDAIEPVGADTTIKRVGGTNATPIVEGIAKAWGNLNGTGVIALRDSLNLANVVDNATKDYTFNLTNAMSNANFAPHVTTNENAGAANTYSAFLHATTPLTTGSLRYEANSNLGTAGDTLYAIMSILGDLA